MSPLHELPRLLLVESDELLRDLISFRLELLGYSVACAEVAADASQLVNSESVDLVVVDLEMQGMDTIDFIERLRTQSHNVGVPVLVLSSSSDPELIRRLHAAGADAYVVMPYDPATLEMKIEQLLETPGRKAIV